MADIILTDKDLLAFKGMLAAQGRTAIDDITVDDVNLLANSFTQAAESARIGRSAADNIVSWRAWLAATNPEDVLIPVLTETLKTWHAAWPDVLPDAPALEERK